MSDDYQTTVSSTGSQRSVEKIRNLSPEQLNLPLPENSEPDDNDVSWEELQEEAVNSARRHSDDSRACAVLNSNEDIHTGVTLETSSRTVHAPVVASLSAVADGEKTIEKFVIYTDSDEKLCGHCRQLLYDFSEGKAEVRVTSSVGEIMEYNIQDLLPD